MKYRSKIKKTTKQYIIVACICIVVIGGAAFITSFLITSQIKEEYKYLLEQAYSDMNKNQKNVFVAKTDITVGEAVTLENVERQKVYSSQPDKNFILEEELGKIALIDIPAGTQIINRMLTDNTIAKELREVEYDVIHISPNVLNNDTIDVRIVYPNGESYIVLSKKILKGYTQEMASCLMWLNEEELLRMSAAIVDAGLYPGSKLFVTKYIEPNVQDASYINYVPSLAILTLLENDPNILERASQELNKEVRKALENRLASSMMTDVTAISWDLYPNVQKRHTTVSEVEDSKDTIASSNQVSISDTEETNGKNKSIEDNNTVNETSIPKNNTNINNDYFYYSEEEKAMGGDTEYGE